MVVAAAAAARLVMSVRAKPVQHPVQLAALVAAVQTAVVAPQAMTMAVFPVVMAAKAPLALVAMAV
jgi:hypothetical protein